MTNFKREARWRQHRWAVDVMSVTSFGSHAGRRTHPDSPPEDVANGTKLLEQDANAGTNFLSRPIFDAASARVSPENRQLHETLDAARLFRDLLSSMPMAFNLFGEASLPENVESRQRLAQTFGVTAGEPSDLVFEWSPARRDDRYTRDRTAFDVALRIGNPHGSRTVVGIETKYHEHSSKEKKPTATKPAALKRWDEQTDFLVSTAEDSGIFKPGWKSAVLDTDLRQIWRDHLLALAMRRQPEWTDDTRYVLLYPSRNVSFRIASDAYAALLVDGDTSYQALTIDEVTQAAFAHGGPTKELFERRYLWWL
jgi:PD-(D/E)XK nuclease superfamily